MWIFMDLIGWGSAILLVGAYGCIALRVMHATSTSYHVMNFIGAIGLTIFSIYKSAWPNAVLNVFWGLVAVVGIIIALRAFKSRSSASSSTSSDDA